MRSGGFDDARPRAARATRVVWSVVAATALAFGALVAVPPTAAAAAAAPANLLTVNQASVESSVRGFVPGTGRESLARTTALHASGRASLRIVSKTKRSMAVRTVMQGQVVSPRSKYSASVLVRPVSLRTTAAPARVLISFMSSSGRTLATVAGAWTTLCPNRWVRVSRTAALAPAGTASVSVWLVIATTRAKDAYVADAWGLWRSSVLPAWRLPVVAPDTIRPTAPSRVAVAASGDPGTLTVSWSASTDNVAMGRYRVFLAPAPGSGATATPTGVVTGTRWTSGLLAPGAWTATVVAIDRSGLTSAASASTTAVLGLPAAGQNMLTDNQASIESSTAGFDPASGTTGTLQLARDTSAALDGASSLRLTTLTSGSVSARTSRNWSPAAPGSAYSASIAVHAGAGTPAGRTAHLQMRFYDAAQGVSPQVVDSSSIAVPASGWARLSLSGVVARSSAAYVTVGLVIDAPNAGESYLADMWGLWRSAALPAWALPPVRTARPLVAILGDSYESGLGTTLEAARWSSLVATRNGWLEANLGRGGTGFVTAAGVGGCGLPVCPTIADMASAAVAAKPDIVLVSGGRNDSSASPAVQAAIENTIATLRAGLPNARIVVISPMWDSSTPGPALASMEAWESASAGAHAAQLVPGAASWLSGHPEWIADGVHPNDLGYAQIAARVLDALG